MQPSKLLKYFTIITTVDELTQKVRQELTERSTILLMQPWCQNSSIILKLLLTVLNETIDDKNTQFFWCDSTEKNMSYDL